jgi:hypothetical protein
LERLGAGAGGGGVCFSPQQAETPSVAAARANKVEVFHSVHERSINIGGGVHQALRS